MTSKWVHLVLILGGVLAILLPVVGGSNNEIPSSFECTDNGVSCYPEGRTISLQSLGLKGTIPATLGDYTDLLSLDLSYNSFSGSIPSELGLCDQLTNLNLTSTSITGQIPTELGNLSNLLVLSIDENLLTGTIPSELGLMTKLQIVRLGANQLKGAIPTELSLCTNISSLTLAKNALRGTLPAEIVAMEALENLDLSSNLLTGTIPSNIGILPHLQYLILSNNSLVGTLPLSLVNITSLLSLDLGSNKLSGSLPSAYGDFLQLNEIYLGYNRLTGKIPSELANLIPAIIDIRVNSICDPIPNQIRSAPGYDVWNFRYNLAYCVPSVTPSFSPTSMPSFPAAEVLERISSSVDASQVTDIYISLGFRLPPPLGSSCANNTECTDGICVLNRCVSATKQCPSAVAGSQCSGRGDCIYWDASGDTTDSCPADDGSCLAACSCRYGYFGAGCHLSELELATENAVRSAVCSKLTELSPDISNISSTIDSTLNTLEDIFSAGTSLNLTAIEACTKTVDVYISSSLDRVKENEPYLPSIMDVVSLALEAVVTTAIASNNSLEYRDSVSNITDVLERATSTILSSLDPGQTALFNTSSFDLNVFSREKASLYGANLSVGRSTIFLPQSGLDSCRGAGDYASVSLLRWIVNPFLVNSFEADSGVFRWTYVGSVMPNNLQVRSENFTMEMPFNYVQNISVTPDRFGNMTKPVCQTFSSQAQGDCDCDLLSYDNHSAVFICNITSNLCYNPLGLSNKHNYNILSAGVTVRDYALILRSTGRVFLSVFIDRPFSVESDRGLAAVAVLAAWIFLFFMGLLYFRRWDCLDRKIFIYATTIAKDSNYKTFDELYDSHRMIDNAFQVGDLSNVVEDDSIRDDDNELIGRLKLASRFYLVFSALTCWIAPVRKRRRISLLLGGNLIPQLIHTVQLFHPLIWFFTFRSLEISRVSRFISTWKTVLIIMMISVIFFDIYYRDDGSCGQLNLDEIECMSLPSKFIDGIAQCEWDPSNRVCTLRPPPSSAQFIISVSVLTAIILIPFESIFHLILFGVCSKRPDLGLIGVDPFICFGSGAYCTDLDRSNHARVENTVTLVLNAFRSEAKGERRTREISKVLSKCGLKFNRDFSDVELTVASSLRFDNIRSCVGFHIQKSYTEANLIVDSLCRCRDDSARESYLIQRFVLEKFHDIENSLLRSHFEHFLVEMPKTISPTYWLLGWLLILGSLIFLIIWIFLWGVMRGAICVEGWGINLLLSSILECLFFSIIRFILFDLIIIRLFKSRLAKAQVELGKLNDSDMEIANDRSSLDPILRFISPSCVAANNPLVYRLQGSRLLRKHGWMESDNWNSISEEDLRLSAAVKREGGTTIV